MTDRKMINLNPQTTLILENRLIAINKARLKAKKKTLNRNDVIALAIENLTVEMGVAK
jgi:hypothetical protein